MTSADTVAAAPARPAALPSLAVALAGIIFYGLYALALPVPPEFAYVGTSIYDQYYLALLDGHLDLPARVLKLEGHYTPDGTGYLYHGLAPLLTRFAFGWMVPLGAMSLAPFSIWLWSVIGSAGYHLAVLAIVRPSLTSNGSGGGLPTLLLALAVWFGSPGLLLASNLAFYSEPIAVAYAATGLFALTWASVVTGRLRPAVALPVLALLAALSLHARPNLAVGLYAATVIAMAMTARTGLRKAALPAVLALAILGASGLGYLGLNAARFGATTSTHGSFETGPAQYGFVYWGIEDAASERAAAFVEHGKFNLRRVPHNAAVYLLDLPAAWPGFQQAGEALRAWAARSLASGLGFIRVEQPHVGILYLWPAWLALAAASAWAGRTLWLRWLPLTAGTAIGALMTLSYGTITLRYRADLWPLIASLALVGLAAAAPRLAAARAALPRAGLAACVLFGLLVSVLAAGLTQRFHLGEAQDNFWSLERCRTMAAAKEFAADRIEVICRAPRGDR